MLLLLLLRVVSLSLLPFQPIVFPFGEGAGVARERETTRQWRHNGRPPVKFSSFKRARGIVDGAAGVVLFRRYCLGGSLVSAFCWSPTEQHACNNLIKMSGFPKNGCCFSSFEGRGGGAVGLPGILFKRQDYYYFFLLNFS